MSEDMQTIPSLEDDFANTRPADDLFDDEIVPNPSPPKEAVVIPTGPRAHSNGRGRGGRGGRERGNRGGGRGTPRGRGSFRGGHQQQAQNTDWKGGDGTGSAIASKHAPPAATASPAPPAPPPATAPATEEADTKTEEVVTEPTPTPTGQETDPAVKDSAEPKADGEEEAPGEKSTPTPPTGPAIRKEFPSRNRINTGGPNRQKLTEEELASRMEAAKLRNQARTEKHNRATEDEAKFNEAEQVRKVEEAKKKAVERRKQVEDGKRKKELDAEREQNRQRKLKALSNREWDVSKNEEDYNPSNHTNRSRRGAHGGISGGVISNPDAGYSREGDGEELEADGDRSFSVRGRGRGRGGRRGDRGDRGGGRGGGYRGGHGEHGSRRDREPRPADIANEAEFPSLPGATKPKVDTNVEKPSQTPGEPETPRGSWAEQAQDAADKAENTEAPVTTTST